jgi:multidrug efflux pump subunit AcrA (membrane-fusion protein)
MMSVMSNRNPHPASSYFSIMERIRLPRPLRVLKYLILCGLFVAFLTLSFVPWVQTAKGFGRITALHPDGQLQAIHALVPGRIQKWHVRDGDEVKAGQPIVDVMDNDPSILTRLKEEINAVEMNLNATRIAAETARNNLDRQKELQRQGLSSRREYEQAIIEYKSWRAKEASIASSLAITQTRLSQQYMQHVVAPTDGRIVRTYAGASATMVKQGDVVADFLPADAVPAVELYVQGFDIPLIKVGQRLRLQFEGWPIVQFSGWPSRAVGTFGGIVSVVDPSVSPDGRLRILVVEPEDEPWPDRRYLTFGARAQGWVLLETVPLGYELWRQLNSFPPEVPAQQKVGSSPK